jgi:hypothetical protein
MSESSSTEKQYVKPSNQALQHCAKLAVIDDKPIMMDYWFGSQENAVLIGVRENGEKLLVKSEDEYTSPIAKIYKVENEYIIVTENSLYLVSASISTKRIS